MKVALLQLKKKKIAYNLIILAKGLFDEGEESCIALLKKKKKLPHKQRRIRALHFWYLRVFKKIFKTTFDILRRVVLLIIYLRKRTRINVWFE